MFTSSELRTAVQTRRVGRTIEVLAATTSTNTVALRRASDISNDGLAVFADYQAAGRGQFDRRWAAPKGSSVLCSMLIFLPEGFIDFGMVGLAAGVAVCQTIEIVGVPHPCLKWPNDVLVRQRKVAGILIELAKPVQNGRIPCVVGIGINCHQQPGDFDPEIRERAGALDSLAGTTVSRFRVSKVLLEVMDEWLADDRITDRATISDHWMRYGQQVGERISLKSGGRVFDGVIVALDPAVGITVELDEGGRRLFPAPLAH